jgi:hypothetical protein
MQIIYMMYLRVKVHSLFFPIRLRSHLTLPGRKAGRYQQQNNNDQKTEDN